MSLLNNETLINSPPGEHIAESANFLSTAKAWNPERRLWSAAACSILSRLGRAPASARLPAAFSFFRSPFRVPAQADVLPAHLSQTANTFGQAEPVRFKHDRRNLTSQFRGYGPGVRTKAATSRRTPYRTCYFPVFCAHPAAD